MDDDTQVIPQPEPQGGPKQPPRTWVVVALTLGAVLVIGGAVAAGFAFGRSSDGDTATTPSAAGGSAPSSEAPTDQDAATGGLDACLVGTWRTTEHTETVDTEQGKFTISDVKRTLEITEDGTETVTYDGTPATLALEAAGGEAIFEGTVTYDVSTSGDTMSFVLGEVDGSLTVRLADGKESEQELQPGSGPVQYTCSEDSFTQTATGYKSVMERVE